MQFGFTFAAQFAWQETGDDKVHKMDTDGRDPARFQLGGTKFPCCALVAYDA